MKTISLLFLTFILSFGSIKAQDIQTPSEFLGYELGEQFTYHHRVVDYFKYVSIKTDLVTLEEYGTTNERRPLVTAFITTKENHEALDQIRTNNLIGAGLVEGSKKGKQLPIVWLSYNIHGNEAASTEAAMKTLYSLVTDPTKRDWLQETIIIIDPCENPDGRDRYTNWYNGIKSTPYNTSTTSYEHNEPWPGGRYNHYLFDLNRDWAWQTQIESQYRRKLYHRWMPHVHVDLHEMGINSPYFFAPAAHPYHDVITKWQNDFQEKVGESHSAYFNKEGWLYFTKEVFDLLYPSYGDTWPTFNGAIGFTYEQGGSHRGGLSVETETGNLLTLKDRLEHHFTASLSTIETAYKNKEKLLSEFNQYFRKGANNPIGDYKSYVIKGSNNPATLEAFLKLLDNQKIKYGFTASTPMQLTGFDYLNNRINNFGLEKDDIVISAFQPHSRFVKVLMEPKTLLEDSLTYDLTAWALPYAYELESYAVRSRLEIKENSWKQEKVDNETLEAPSYAMVARWKDVQDVTFLGQLLQKGIKVRFAKNNFRVAGQYFERGTLLVTKEDNRRFEGRYDEVVADIGRNLNVAVYPVNTGLVDLGNDFGSSSMTYIKPMKVALIAGDDISPMAFGETWHYFEQVIKYPVTILHTNYLSYVDLSEFDVIVLASGSYGKYASSFVDFAKEGGKIIAIERAVNVFSGSSKTTLGTSKKRNIGSKRPIIGVQRRYADRERSSASSLVAGSIFKVYLDETHPLAFGNDNTVHLMKRNSQTYPLLSSGQWNVGIFKNTSHISGFVGYRLKRTIPNSLAIGVESIGDGEIVYFSDSPIIRGFWHSGKLLLGNAIFLVGQ